MILPLRNEKISSGQMVLISAMALGKPIIITQTPTTIEYGEHMKSLYFVKPDSINEMISAVNFLTENPQVRSTLGNAAKDHYEAHHSIQPFVNGLVNALEIINAD